MFILYYRQIYFENISKIKIINIYKSMYGGLRIAYNIIQDQNYNDM
jgi:hypothetical protein